MKPLSAIYLSSRREMWVVFGIWLVFCVWVVGYCSMHAYTTSGPNVQMVVGLPSWVFWGVAVPWCAATAVSIIFALFFIEDHSLEPTEDHTNV